MMVRIGVAIPGQTFKVGRNGLVQTWEGTVPENCNLMGKKLNHEMMG